MESQVVFQEDFLSIELGPWALKGKIAIELMLQTLDTVCKDGMPITLPNGLWRVFNV